MIKTAEQRIREYLVSNPNATKKDVINNVFFGYVGNGKQAKAIDKQFKKEGE